MLKILNTDLRLFIESRLNKRLYCKNYFNFSSKKRNISSTNKNSKKVKNIIANENKLNFEKDIEQYDSQDLVNEIETKIPIKFNKNNFLKSDQNLTGFVPINKILNKTKAVALTKNFLDNFLIILNNPNNQNFENLNNFCDENFTNKLYIELEKLIMLKKDPNFHLKYKVSLKNEENKEILIKKFNFNINLYNVKNYIFLGVETNRRGNKNLKYLNHNRDVFMENPTGDININKTIKTDIISNKDSFKLGNQNHENIPFTLISQLEFSAIPTKLMKLNISIQDELNEISSNFDFVLNSIDFKIECEILKMNFDEINKLEKELRNNQEDEDELLDSNFDESKQVHKNNFKALTFLDKSELNDKFKYELKIIDIDNYLNGNELI